jgi:hypothetical protein
MAYFPLHTYNGGLHEWLQRWPPSYRSSSLRVHWAALILAIIFSCFLRFFKLCIFVIQHEWYKISNLRENLKNNFFCNRHSQISRKLIRKPPLKFWCLFLLCTINFKKQFYLRKIYLRNIKIFSICWLWN